MGMVSITNHNVAGEPDLVVHVQTIVDEGRERLPNGRHTIKPGATKQVLVDADTCYRVSEGEISTSALEA